MNNPAIFSLPVLNPTKNKRWPCFCLASGLTRDNHIFCLVGTLHRHTFLRAQKRLIKEQLAWQEIPGLLHPEWLMLSGQSEITSSKSQIHSFSQFHPLSTKLSPRNQEETRIAAQERKAFDFEVGDGWKDLSPNLLQSNDSAKCFYTVIECTSLQSLRICLTQAAGGAVPVSPCREEVWMLVLFYHVLSVFIYQPHDCPSI